MNGCRYKLGEPAEEFAELHAGLQQRLEICAAGADELRSNADLQPSGAAARAATAHVASAKSSTCKITKKDLTFVSAQMTSLAQVCALEECCLAVLVARYLVQAGARILETKERSDVWTCLVCSFLRVRL